MLEDAGAGRRTQGEAPFPAANEPAGVAPVQYIAKFFGDDMFFVPVLIGRHNRPGNIVAVLEAVFVHIHIFFPQLGFLKVVFIVFPLLGSVADSFLQPFLLFIG